MPVGIRGARVSVIFCGIWLAWALYELFLQVQLTQKGLTQTSPVLMHTK